VAGADFAVDDDDERLRVHDAAAWAGWFWRSIQVSKLVDVKIDAPANANNGRRSGESVRLRVEDEPADLPFGERASRREVGYRLKIALHRPILALLRA
jgi:hypothetical protein